MCQTALYGNRASPTRRLATLQLLAMCIFSPGCWQEVHYIPNEIPSEKLPAPPNNQSVATDLSPAAEPHPSRPEPPPPRTAETLPLGAPSATTELIKEDSESARQDPGAIQPPQTGATTELPAAAGSASLPPQLSTNGRASALATWQMASQWSMAVALQAKGRNAESYGERLAQAEHEAKQLGVTLPELPTHADEDDRLSANLTFLLEDAGPQLSRELSETHGANHAALAELATKTHVLLLSYTPNSARMEPIVAAIRRAAQNSGLPEEIWQDLVELLNSRAEFNEVKTAIFRLHERAVTSLTELRP